MGSELERDVAIKILHRRVGDTRLKDRLLQEGRALAKIRHNNVVNVLGIEAHGDRVGLCMEFVRGNTLADIVRGQGKMSAAEAVLIGQDLCRALSAVHRAGYVHRDVKAKNVMRDDTGRIVLMDFGTGRTAEIAGGQGDRAGTPLYMAPEAIEGGRRRRAATSTALGVLLYHLVTGDYPVKAELCRRTSRRAREPAAPVAQRGAAGICRWRSCRSSSVPSRSTPEERYANASEFLAALSGLRLEVNPLILATCEAIVGGRRCRRWDDGARRLTSSMFNVVLQRSDFAD